MNLSEPESSFESPAESSVRTPALALAAAGLLVVGGSFLEWISGTAAGEIVSRSGTELPHGIWTSAAGVVMLLTAAPAFTPRQSWAARLLPPIGAAAAVTVIVAVAGVVASPGARIAFDLLPKGVSRESAIAVTDASVSVGVYAVLTGALLALVACALAVRRAPVATRTLPFAAAAGWVLVAGGPFLPWGSGYITKLYDHGPSEPATATGPGGVVHLDAMSPLIGVMFFIAVALLIASIALRFLASPRRLHILNLATIVAAVFSGAVTVYDVVAFGRGIVTTAAESEQVGGRYVEVAQTAPDTGVFVVLAGALIALVSAVVSIRRAAR